MDQSFDRRNRRLPRGTSAMPTQGSERRRRKSGSKLGSDHLRLNFFFDPPIPFFINVFTDCSGFEALLITRQSDDFHLYHRRADAFIVVLSRQMSTGNNLNVQTDRTRSIYLEFI